MCSRERGWEEPVKIEYQLKHLNNKYKQWGDRKIYNGWYFSDDYSYMMKIC